MEATESGPSATRPVSWAILGLCFHQRADISGDSEPPAVQHCHDSILQT